MRCAFTLFLSLFVSCVQPPPAEPGDEPEIRDLIRDLDADDARVRDRAEAELIRIGPRVLEAVREALVGARPELRERAVRVIRWVGPDWIIDPAAHVERWYKGYLKAKLPGFKPARMIEVSWTGSEMREVHGKFRFFKAVTNRCKGTSHGHRIVIDRGGWCRIWSSSLEDIRHVLKVCGLRAETAADVARVGRICHGLFVFEAISPEEEKRMEVQGREFVYHDHTMLLLSGRVGSYSEDRIFRFGPEGRLAAIENTGIPDMTMQDRDRIIDEADPRLRLSGFVGESRLKELRARQKEHKGPLPQHDRK
jgi:hypothetical protein